jgi:hypothetical protein
MTTTGSASKRSLIVASILVLASACSGTTSTNSAASAPASTSVEASPQEALQAVTDVLHGGRYLFGPFGKGSVMLSAKGPNGWTGYPDWAMDGPEPVRADAPHGIGVAFFSANGVFTDPCHWDWNDTGRSDVADQKVGPSVEDLVTALRANTYYTSTAAKPVTIDGYSGQELVLQMPGGSYEHCDKDDPNDAGGHVFPFSGPGLYAQGPANRWDLYILDVHGTRLISVILSYAKTPQADLNTARNIIRTMDIDPKDATA